MAYVPSLSTRSSQNTSIADLSVSHASNKLTHPHLITFLAAVQQRQIDFVPVTWQEGLGFIGQGGTAHISQVQINNETSFAFKRALRNEASSWVEDSASIYDVLTTDILVLTHPAIQGHPNIVKLIGFCWEITDDNQVYPVIVLEKAGRGDLKGWACSLDATIVSFEAKLGLCVDIGSALQVLHDNNIVHGDLKPENILVFADEARKPTAKLTDFGYSSFGWTEEDIVYPSYSEIWSAPECHDRGMTLQAVKKNDVYAFGLIAIYLMFMDSLTGDNEVWDFYLRQEYPEHNLPEWIGMMKSTDRLLERTLGITSDKVQNDYQRAALQQFFRGTLSLRPEQRESNMNVLTHLLESARLKNAVSLPKLSAPKLEPRWDDVSHLDFSISKSILSLTMIEYRVREEIHLALEQRTSDLSFGGKVNCERCFVQGAFQRALCYKIGFGTPLDAEKSTDFLSISTKGKSDLQNELLILSQTRPEPSNGQNDFAKLWDEGFLFTSDSDFRDLPDPKISDFEARYVREISDMDSVLGDNNAITHPLKIGLATAYEQQGNFEMAEKTCRLALQSSIKVLGDRHMVTLECMDRLARILWGIGDLIEAESLQRSALDSMKKLLGNEHIRTTRLLSSLCDTLEIRGRFKEIEHTREEVYNNFCVILGVRHPAAMDNWAVSKRYAGNLKFSATLHSVTINDCELVFGPNNPMTLNSIVNHAEVLSEQGDYVKAEALHRKAVDGFESQLGTHHPKTAIALHSFGKTLERQSRWLEAGEIYHRALSAREAVSGDKRTDILLSRSAWAPKQVAKSRKQLCQTLQISETLTGKEASDTTYLSFAFLATALEHQGKWAEAVDLHSQALKRKKEILGDKHPATIFTTRNPTLAKANIAPKAGISSGPARVLLAKSFDWLERNKARALRRK